MTNNISISEIDAYHKILNLPNPTTNQEQIKNQYKQLVLKHHPDKGGNPEIFKQIQQAYEFLLQYSQFLSLSKLNSNSQPYQGKCSDINLILEMTLEEFYNGKKTPMIITHDKICPKCQGNGYLNLPNHQPQACHCPPPHPPTCSFCLGTNVLLTLQNLCSECKGIRVIKNRHQLDIQLPPGLKPGDNLTILNVGNEYPQKAKGKVFLTIKESKQSHPYFIRKGNDLHIKQRIHLTEALAGHQFNLTLLDQTEIQIQTTSVITPGQTKSIANLGMPLRHSPRKKGNLIIHFEVLFPGKLIPATQLQQILQQPINQQSTPQSNRIYKI